MKTAILMFVCLSLATPGTALASGGGPVKMGPKGIPFTCSDARSLRAYYEGGGPKATVKLVFDDGATWKLDSAPTLYGRNYASAGPDGQTVYWSTNGLGATIRQASAISAAEPQEIARCTRGGRDGSAPHDDTHH
ncbi:hypothetical protein [Allosphingosinicella indica]|uniref:C-type lysozyme inhibitor domain-containing protein n=1 Tax=Allosphingosinicella indica TaxID=941907 RepID=A0A1X7GTB1_9SPHN|nr:hypothetical protein [Allosphingosinicella indica]SMF74167.1 hypothetical protein SAMN06295910_2213 [Allosphingosinicella indica]